MIQRNNFFNTSKEITLHSFAQWLAQKLLYPCCSPSVKQDLNDTLNECTHISLKLRFFFSVEGENWRTIKYKRNIYASSGPHVQSPLIFSSILEDSNFSIYVSRTGRTKGIYLIVIVKVCFE